MNSNKPFFSVITICLNAGDSLHRTLESIINQTFLNFEIVVKDGISTDGSFDKINKDDRIFFIQKADKGIYDAMNQALEFVNGQYILFLNAGDYFFNDKILQSYYNTIINNGNPNLVYCDYLTTNLNLYVQSPLKLSNFFLFRTMLCHQVCMINKQCYDNFGNFDLSYRVCSDYDFLLRLVKKERINSCHFQELGIVSESNGFSSQFQKLAKLEVKKIRRKYYKKEFFFFNIIIFLTFPSIRQYILNRNNFLSVFYIKLVNIVNKTIIL
ncbi:MAG: glycosyltransferase [Bacteroidia bacterium]